MSVAHDFAFQRWIERAYARQQRPLDFRAQTVAEWQTWRARLREKIETLAGIAALVGAASVPMLFGLWSTGSVLAAALMF